MSSMENQEKIVFDSIFLNHKNETVKMENGLNILCNVISNGVNCFMSLAKNNLQAAGISLVPNLNENNKIDDVCDPIEGCSKSQWCDESTRFLIEKFAEYLPEVGPMKKFKTKSHLLKKVAEEINENFLKNFSGIQCDSRFKTVKKRKSAAIKQNKTSGNTGTRVEFQDELAKVAAIDDSMQPEVKLGVGGRMEVIEKIAPNIQNSRKRKRIEDCLQWKIHESSMETLRKIHAEKEVAKRRRHKEKMDFLKQITGTLGSESKSSEPIV